MTFDNSERTSKPDDNRLRNIYKHIARMLTLALVLLYIGNTAVVVHGGAPLPSVIPITTDPADQHEVEIDGDRIVWVDERKGGASMNIYMYDISTGKEMPITDVDEDILNFPDISGDHIIWWNEMSTPSVFDLSSYKEIPVPYLPGFSDDANDPHISGDLAVYMIATVTPVEIYYGIYVYDLSTGTTSLIHKDDVADLEIEISGDRIVWQHRNGPITSSDIYMYDLSTGIETPISTDPSDQRDPSISGDRIVWQDMRNGNWDIYMYDLSGGKETRITTDPSDQTNAEISGDRIVWQDMRNGNPDIYMYDISSGKETRITSDPSDQEHPAISGDHIVWVDERNGNLDIYMYTVSIPVPNMINIDRKVSKKSSIKRSEFVKKEILKQKTKIKQKIIKSRSTGRS